MSVVSVETLKRLKRRAIEHGARPEVFSDLIDGKPRFRRVLCWDVALNCQSPVVREYSSTVSELVPNMGKRMPIETVIMTVRCRKCEVCLNMRGRLWSAKAAAECDAAWRTWFCTFTARPEVHMQAEYSARSALLKKGVNFDELTQFQQFSERAKILGRECTLFFKRARKNSGATLRYLLVVEEHTGSKDGGTGANLGMPHFHALIHDCNPNAPLKKEVIEEAWTIGFSKSRLLEDRYDGDRLIPKSSGARYVAKYLSKTMLARVRASQHYGEVVGTTTSETISDHSRTKF